MKQKVLSLAVVLILLVAMALPTAAASDGYNAIMQAVRGVKVIPKEVADAIGVWLETYDAGLPLNNPGDSGMTDDILQSIAAAATVMSNEQVTETAELVNLSELGRAEILTQIFNVNMYFGLTITHDKDAEWIEVHDPANSGVLVVRFSLPEWLAANPKQQDGGEGDWVTVYPSDPVDTSVNPIKQTGGGMAAGSLIAVGGGAVAVLALCAVGARKKKTS